MSLLYNLSMKIEAVIFDYNRTLVIGEGAPPQFFPETLEVLAACRARGIRMAVISVGVNPFERTREFELLKLGELGISVFKIVAPGEPKDLQPVLDKLRLSAQACVVVGDRVTKEILEGNRVGATTVWYRNGKFAQEQPRTLEEKPNFIIDSLKELIPIIDSLTNINE